MHIFHTFALGATAFAFLGQATPAKPGDLYVREAMASVSCGNDQVI
jgi:hypothetical protein